MRKKNENARTEKVTETTRAEKTIRVRFVKNFEGHLVAEELEIPASRLVHFQEWDAVEVVK
jgi:hypothetical protein